jgi:hypothetical protein
VLWWAARSKLAIKTAEKLAFLAGASQQGGERSSTEVALDFVQQLNEEEDGE